MSYNRTKNTGKSCVSSRSCSNLLRFKPSFPPGDIPNFKYYYKHRMRIANVVSQIDTNPPKTSMKYCNRKPGRIFAAIDLRNTYTKKITRAIANQFLGPSKVDCWNLKFTSVHDKIKEKTLAQHRRRINEQTKSNLADLMRYSKVKTQYCRFDQLKQWEDYVNKSKFNAIYEHCWKDPFYTPMVLHNKNITRPTDINKLRWIDFKDPHMIEFRGGVDWNKDDFDRMLKLMWELRCSDCPSFCQG